VVTEPESELRRPDPKKRIIPRIGTAATPSTRPNATVQPVE
jgi:hypothetical protein